MLIQIVCVTEQERHIVLPVNVNDVLQRVEGEVIYIIVITVIKRVVQGQCEFFSLFRAEDSAEDAVFVHTVWFHLIAHKSPSKTGFGAPYPHCNALLRKEKRGQKKGRDFLGGRPKACPLLTKALSSYHTKTETASDF